MVAQQPSEFKKLLADGVDGLFVKLAGTETLEAASAYFDFCVVDLEHSALGEAEALHLLQYSRALGFPAFLRLAKVDPALINRALEAGATGIQLSNVQRTADVAAARKAMAFPPDGSRSVSTAHAGARFGATALREYVAHDFSPVLVVQIEDITSEDPLEKILGAGADVAFVGTSDLSTVTGFDHATITRRVEEIAASASSVGVAFGGFRLERSDALFRISCSDVSLFIEALTHRPRKRSLPALATTWDDLPSEFVRPGVSRCAVGTDDCILVMNTCEPSMELRPHSHAFDQIALFTSGHGRYHIGEACHEVGPGSVLLIPAGMTHYMETVAETVKNLDVFAPAREDYLHLLNWLEDAGGGIADEDQRTEAP